MIIISQSAENDLTPFTSFYKNFKGSFFKVVIRGKGCLYFYDGESPRFPFY